MAAGIGAGLVFVLSADPPSFASAEEPAPQPVPAIFAGARAIVAAAARELCPAGMVKISRGQFYMGSHEPTALANEKPSFNVRVDTFCMDLTEVRVRDYKACSDQGACPRAGRDVQWPGITTQQRKVYGAECNDARGDRLDHPINCVSWAMAARYCGERGARLPTEAEWEYATRGHDVRVYPWGDEQPTPRHLNACGPECVSWGEDRREPLTALFSDSDGWPTTAPVGLYPAGRSRFGPYDVVGNVWEWVADWYADYTPAEKVNPKGPAAGEKRVIRGGGWNGSYATWLRPSFRYAQDPEALSAGIGFRCALSLPRGS
jgi:formylglycine-generating enzyme required for sulfatase activity